MTRSTPRNFQHPAGLPQPLAWLQKLRRHLALLRHDPEKFGRNLLQFSNPQRFQEQLLDVQRAPALQVRLEPGLRHRPALNVLQPVLSAAVMTGGPNTVVNLALWIAQLGLPVRIVTNAPTPSADLQWFWQHLATLTGAAQPPPGLSVVAAGDAQQPLPIGPCDMFLATHWTTAQQVKALLARMQVQCFFYLIQDFEPGFYAWSSNYALAMQTYGLEHIGVFNQRLLYDYFVAQAVGCYASPAGAARALVFEPAVDRRHFHPACTARPPGPRRLLYYARASNPRNLLGLGLDALRLAVADPVFAQADWEFWAIGGNNSLPCISLGPGQVLQPAPWASYAQYAALLREADLLLCPMLSPHTSYPVLEMAACGGAVVTTSFATKTAARLAAISPQIFAAPATAEGLAGALVQAASHAVQAQATPRSNLASPDSPTSPDTLALPESWEMALRDTARSMVQRFHEYSAPAA